MSVTERTAEDLLKQCGAWQSGHFLLSSGLHSNEYVQCQKLLQYPRYGLVLADRLAERVIEAGLRPSVVVGPALGAVHMELLVALALDRHIDGEPVRAVFAERTETGDGFAIRRGIELGEKDSVLIVEDVTTTGGSARKVLDLVSSLGARPVAVAALVDRSAGSVSFGVPFFPLVRMTIAVHEPSSCPWCEQGLPLSKPGSSKQKL